MQSALLSETGEHPSGKKEEIEYIVHPVCQIIQIIYAYMYFITHLTYFCVSCWSDNTNNLHIYAF